MIEKQKTFLIAGITGDLGRTYARALVHYGRVYGISRSKESVSGIAYTHLSANLLDAKTVESVFSDVPKNQDLVYIHAVGKFRFEDTNHPIVDTNGDGIDDETFQTNVQTFRNIRPYLENYVRSSSQASLKVVDISSASDIYHMPFWQSFTSSKELMRKDIREMYGNPQTFGRIGTVRVNVTTVSGLQLNNERPILAKNPYAFCLSPQDVVDGSLKHILSLDQESLEVTLIKSNPDFLSPDFLSLSATQKRWYAQMYGERTPLVPAIGLHA